MQIKIVAGKVVHRQWLNPHSSGIKSSAAEININPELKRPEKKGGSWEELGDGTQTEVGWDAVSCFLCN